ncbi:MAG: TonB-dependent receptor domain-containing protein, partial [Bacteroidia bacterium]
MKFKIIIFLMLLSSMLVKSQSVGGTVNDSLSSPVPYIPIALLSAKDSSIIKGTNTNEKGSFIFEGIKPGKYIIKVAAAGHIEKTSAIYSVDSLSNITIDPLVLHSSAFNLGEVSVTVAKKLVEFKNGNITVNIQDSPLAIGNSLYDLLSRLPTVSFIDDVISIQGKQGVRILIDDRLQQMSGQQLVTLLKSIQASNIDKIEILKNPPVRYDAAGTGFISVKTKKLKITGFSGSTNISYQQGFYANKDGGLSLNYKGRSFAIFSNLNFGNDEYRYTSIFNKAITYNGTTTNFNQLTSEKNSNLYTSYSVGSDFYINRRNTLGLRIDGSNGSAIPDRKGANNLSDGSLGYNQLQFGSVRPNAWNYVNYNFNAEHLFDTVGTILKFSADYSPNLDLNRGDFQNYFLDSAGNNKLQPRIFKSDNNLKFIIYSSKLDFEKQLTKTLKLEAGAKGNNQEMMTNFNFNNKDPLTGEYSIDTTFTNGFTYKEQIYAGYVNILKQYKKLSWQGGVRGENTSIRAGSNTNNVKYTRDYFNLFPMASINYNPSETHSFQLSYNRRINRPNYTSFNPYKYFVNLFVSFQGNPYLMPEYHNMIEFTYGYKSSIYNTVSFSKVNNIFYGYPVQNDSTKETQNKTANLSDCFNYSYSLFIQKEFTKWWRLTLDGVVSYLTFSGKIDSRDYSGVSFQYYSSFNNQFTLPKSVRIELSGQYFAPGNVVIFNNKNRWGINLAIRKS